MIQREVPHTTKFLCWGEKAPEREQVLQVLKNEQHFEFVHAKEWTDAELGQLVDDYLLLTKKQRSLSLEVDVRIDANKILLRWMIAYIAGWQWLRWSKEPFN